MIDKRTIKSVLVGIGAVLLDFYIHKQFTFPQETYSYFFYKFIIYSLIAYVYYSQGRRDTQAKLVFAGIATAIFSLYYRVWEVFFKLPFSERTPDIIFNGITYTVETHPYIQLLFWIVVHGIAFFIPVLLLEPIFKR